MIIFEKQEKTVCIDKRNTMYPSYAVMLFNDETTLDFNFYTAYGYAYDDSVVTVNNDHYIIRKKEFFSIPVREENVTFSTTGRLFVVARLGFIGQHVIGKTESVGRLSYIDGCSDSLLIYFSVKYAVVKSIC